MAQYASRADLALLGLPASALTLPPDMLLADFQDAQDRQLIAASQKIDSYLTNRYAVPLSGTVGPPNTYPGQFVQAAVSLARWEFLTWLGFNPDPDNFDNSYKQSYDATIRWLENIAKGVVSVDLPPPGGTGTTPVGSPVIYSTEARGWGDESFIGEPMGYFWGGTKE